MPERSVKQLQKGRDASYVRRTNWLSTWRDGYRYAMPQRDIIDQPRPGQPKGNLVYDSTAINSVAQFANKIQQALFPPFQDHIQLEPGPGVPKDQMDNVMRILEDAAKKHHAALHRSNFAITINEFLLELAMGTGIMMLLEGPDDDPYNFVSCATPTVSIEEGPWGGFGALYREHKLPISVYREQWKDGIVPARWEELEKEDPDAEVSFCEATYADWDAGKWYYELWEDEGEQKLLRQPRVYDFASPWIVTRWGKAANEVYGRGPLLFALPDIRTCNRVIELLLQNASLSVAGTYTVTHDGVTNPNTARIIPGGFIPVARNAGHPQGPSIAALERAGSFDLGAFILNDMRANIRRMLFDRGLPEPQGTPPSATEIIERLKEVQTEQGPAFGRMMDELVTPMTTRGLTILNRKGQLQFPIKIDGSVVAVRVTSPLARAQALDDIEGLVQWIEIVAGMLGQESLAIGAKIEDIPAWLGQKLGVDPALIRSDDEREQLKQRIGEMMAQQAVDAQAGAATAQGPNAPQPAMNGAAANA